MAPSCLLRLIDQHAGPALTGGCGRRFLHMLEHVKPYEAIYYIRPKPTRALGIMMQHTASSCCLMVRGYASGEECPS